MVVLGFVQIAVCLVLKCNNKHIVYHWLQQSLFTFFLHRCPFLVSETSNIYFPELTGMPELLALIWSFFTVFIAPELPKLVFSLFIFLHLGKDKQGSLKYGVNGRPPKNIFLLCYSCHITCISPPRVREFLLITEKSHTSTYHQVCLKRQTLPYFMKACLNFQNFIYM